MVEQKKGKRGFGSMDPERVREIARTGGKAAHASGRAHQFTAEEARVAGSKGGKAPHPNGRGAGTRRVETTTTST